MPTCCFVPAKLSASASSWRLLGELATSRLCPSCLASPQLPGLTPGCERPGVLPPLRGQLYLCTCPGAAAALAQGAGCLCASSEHQGNKGPSRGWVRRRPRLPPSEDLNTAVRKGGEREARGTSQLSASFPERSATIRNIF